MLAAESWVAARDLAFADDEKRVVAAIGLLHPVNIAQRIDRDMRWPSGQERRQWLELELKAGLDGWRARRGPIGRTIASS